MHQDQWQQTETMHQKNFIVLLIILFVYILVGAFIFQRIELPEEIETNRRDIEKRKNLMEMIKKHHVTDEEISALNKLEKYCGKPLKNVPVDIEPRWDLYQSIFFAANVANTIGFGNLVPTTMTGRIFTICYAFIGIPINGFIILAIGKFFEKSFTRLYHRWKKSNDVDPYKLGLVVQIILYLVPGFIFFIFVPSIIFSAVENWTYEEAVYYSFITLTTIGLGDYIAGDRQSEIGSLYNFYQIFILIWISIGIGYFVMILNFIDKGMRFRKLQEFENQVKDNVNKIRLDLLSIVGEFFMVRLRKVYKKPDHRPQKSKRSESCPNLSNLQMNRFNNVLQRIQSENDLARIDKELTFKSANLIIEVVKALSIDDYIIDGFSNSKIEESFQFYKSSSVEVDSDNEIY